MSEPVSLARPRALKEGDRVAVICVSGPVEPEALNAGLDALRFAGLDPVTYPSAHDPGTMRPYLAGDDAMRAGDLRSALTEPGIAGILFARGGSGAQRTLEAMDWDGLGPETGLPPKVVAGYSDVTALLEAVAVRLGWASVFGPMVAIREGASHYSFGSLLRTLMRPEQATLIRYPRAVTVVPGLARGVTTGGTLLSGPIADRIGARYAFALTSILSALSMLLMLGSRQIAALAAYVVVGGMMCGASGVLIPLLILEALGMKRYGALMGISGIFGTLGFAAGPVVTGRIFDLTGSYAGALWMFAAAMLVCTLAALACRSFEAAIAPARAASALA